MSQSEVRWRGDKNRRARGSYVAFPFLAILSAYGRLYTREGKALVYASNHSLLNREDVLRMSAVVVLVNHSCFCYPFRATGFISSNGFRALKHRIPHDSGVSDINALRLPPRCPSNRSYTLRGGASDTVEFSKSTRMNTFPDRMKLRWSHPKVRPSSSDRISPVPALTLSLRDLGTTLWSWSAFSACREIESVSSTWAPNHLRPVCGATFSFLQRKDRLLGKEPYPKDGKFGDGL